MERKEDPLNKYTKGDSVIIEEELEEDLNTSRRASPLIQSSKLKDSIPAVRNSDLI